VKEARADAIRKKAEIAAAVPVVAEAEAPVEGGEAVAAENTEA
jgi:hypothetical protein